jgi:hypothetical protein
LVGHDIPYRSRVTLFFDAFETQAGDPGTVEKIDPRSVVTSPVGPRYGSIEDSRTPGIETVPEPPTSS